MRSLLFILLSYVSALGDTLFLTGIPLHFFKTHNGAIYATTFIQIAITLTILLSRKLIISTNKKNPLLVTGVGELSLAGIEVLILAANLLGASEWINVIGVVPLALIYNAYAPAKFLKLQDFFFPHESAFHLTAIQSGATRFGALTGIMLSGWMVETQGIVGILIVDILSFVIFGSAMLYFYRKAPVAAESAPSVQSATPQPSISPFLALNGAMIMISLVALFTSWERASSISVVAKSVGDSVVDISLQRGIAGGIGVLVGIVISKYWQRMSVNIWLALAITLSLGMAAFGSLEGIAPIYLFLGGGVLSVLAVPIQRKYYKLYEEKHGTDSQVFSRHFIYNAILSFSLLPIGYLADLKGFLNPLQISGLAIAVTGLLGGWVVLKKLRSDKA